MGTTAFDSIFKGQPYSYRIYDSDFVSISWIDTRVAQSGDVSLLPSVVCTHVPVLGMAMHLNS